MSRLGVLDAVAAVLPQVNPTPPDAGTRRVVEMAGVHAEPDEKITTLWSLRWTHGRTHACGGEDCHGLRPSTCDCCGITPDPCTDCWYEVFDRPYPRFESSEFGEDGRRLYPGVHMLEKDDFALYSVLSTIGKPEQKVRWFDE